MKELQKMKHFKTTNHKKWYLLLAAAYISVLLIMLWAMIQSYNKND